MQLRHRNGQVLVSLVVEFFLRYGYCFSYCCTKKASSEVEPDRLEAELVVALHYVACSRTPTALNLSASTEKSKGWLLGTENTLL